MGLEELKHEQLVAFEPYWIDTIQSMTLMDQEELKKVADWAERMSTDADFANQWLYTVKTLFDIEDVNKDGNL